MTDDDSPDTVTPLDGDGHNVTGVQEQFVGDFDPFDKNGNVNPGHYETQGRTVVATPRGYRFSPQDKAIPTITRDGIKVTKEQADALVTESGGLVTIKNEED